MNVTPNGSTWLRRAARLFAMTAIAGSVACSGCGDDPTNNNNEDVTFDITIAPTSQNFGALLAGNTSSASTFTVTNEGPGTASGFNVGITGADAGDFTITGDDCSDASLDDGGECEISVEFTPSAEGRHTASLDVTAGDAAASAALQGTGQAPGELAISPTPHDFGTVVVGETSGTMEFTVTNTGDGETGELMANLNGGNATAFQIEDDGCTGTTLEAEATCTITALFAPGSAGSLSTTLRVVGGPDNGQANAALSGTAVNPASLNITPGSQNFGSVVENTTSDNVTFTVENTGGADSGEIASSLGGADAGEFTLVTDNCNGSVLSAGDDCTIVINFGPGTAGDFTASLDVSATPGGSDSAALTGTGVEPGDLTITPTPHDFGTVVVGQTSGSQTFTVENTGGAATGNLTASLSGAHPNNFAIVGGTDACTGNTLSAGGTCTISVTFSPSTDGLRNATLGVNQSGGGGSATAELSGTGQTPAQLQIMPPSQNFGSVVVGEESTATTFTITNIGQATSGVPNVVLGGTNFGSFNKGPGCTAALAGGDSCTVDVTCEPNTTGTKNATLDATANPGGSASATITCEGVTEGSINVSTSTMTFGDVVNGGTSGLQTVVVNNPGTTATGTITTTIGGDFFIVNDTCTGNTLAGGTNCDIAVQFAPTTVGPAADDLVVSDGTTNRTVALSGNSLPEFTITPSTPDPYDFGGTDVDTLGNSQTFTVTNTAGTGSQTRELTAVVADDEFNATSNSCDGSAVAAGGNCTVTVRFEPTGAPGTRNGTITVTDNFGVTKVRDLTGTALSPFDLDISPVDHDFGMVTIGTTETVTFTITNTTGMATTLLQTQFTTGGDEFGIVTDECAGNSLDAFGGANDRCTITIIFFPTVTPAQTANVTVVSNTASTSTVAGTAGDITGAGIGAAELSDTSPGPAAFGTIVATDSETHTFEITNVGSAETGTITTTLSGSSIFSLAANNCVGASSTLDESGGMNDSCDVRVEVSPDTTDALGSHEATLSFSATPGGTVTIDLTASVGNRLVKISPTTEPVLFGTNIVDDPAGNTQTFVVSNESATAITNAPAVSTTGPFVVDDNNCPSLDADDAAAGGPDECNVVVRFAPTTVGAEQAGTLTIGSDVASSVTWELEGNAISDAELQWVNVGFLDFGTLEAGQTSFVRTFTLQNTGDSQADGVALEPSSPDFNVSNTFNGPLDAGLDNTCHGVNLTPGASCYIEVQFAPGSAGVKTLDLDASATNQLGTTTADSITVTGEGVADSNFVLDPRTSDFGTAIENTDGSTTTFNVTNNTGATVSNLSVTPSTTDFTVVTASDTCSTNDLLAGGACSFDVMFTPGSVGLHNADLTVSGSAGAETVTATLFGEGQSQAALAHTDGDPDFGDVVEGESSGAVTFTITNSGTQDVGSFTFTKTGGPNVDWFTVNTTPGGGVANDCGSQGVAGNSTCVFTVTFDPVLDLAAGADLNISPDVGNDVNIALSGQGVTDWEFEISPDMDLDCGTNVAVGAESTCSVTVTNVGGIESDPFRLNLTSDDGNLSHLAGDWTLDSWTCAEGDNLNKQPGEVAPFEPLGPGASCDVTVKFAPTTITNDLDREAEFHITTASCSGPDTFGSTNSCTLAGPTLITANSVSALSSPAEDDPQTFSVAFGSSTSQTFTFTNAAGTPATGPLHVFVQNDSSNEYSVMGDCAGNSLAAGASCDVTVTFTPTTVASGKDADLVVTDDPTDLSTNNHKLAVVEMEGEGT